MAFDKPTSNVHVSAEPTVTLDGSTPSEPPVVEFARRYSDLGRLARGASGEVRRVWDQRLDAPMVMKVLWWDHLENPQIRARFWREASQRFADAATLAEEVAAWMDGARRREHALSVVADAEARVPEATQLRADAASLRERAVALLEGVAGWQPEEDKAQAWSLQDEADAQERRANVAELERESLLRGALTHEPTLPEAHAALAERYREAHAEAEMSREDATREAILLRAHSTALPTDHPTHRSTVTYLCGDGALSLVTDPPGAEVHLYRYGHENRRWVPVFERVLGETPLHEVPLPMGRYLCELRHPDRLPVRYPIHIARGQHWHGVPPEGQEPHPIHLPTVAEVGPEDRYVPAGWFEAGGDGEASLGAPRQRLWCPGFVLQARPLDVAGLLVFVNDLVARGRPEDAIRFGPQERGGAAIFGFDGTLHHLQPDADGDLWSPDWPAMMVDWFGAQAYARWWSERTRHPWRLIGALEREKAARGVDGRCYPWGDAFDPSWTVMFNSHRGPVMPQPVAAARFDESPYGVRGLAGVVRSWCSDRWDTLIAQRGPVVSVDLDQDEHTVGRVICGGSWASGKRICRAASRNQDRPNFRDPAVGIRLARPLDPPWFGQ